MKANELRIGNLVNYRDEETLMVSNIGYTFATENYKTLIVGSDDINDYNPIPLTEEWLLRFGFKEGFDVVFSKNTLDFKKEAFGYRFTVNDWISPLIMDVHQLQNLYFGLTGQDLEIIEKQDLTTDERVKYSHVDTIARFI